MTTGEMAVLWALLGYGTLALVLAVWAAYEMSVRIIDRKIRGKGRHRG